MVKLAILTPTNYVVYKYFTQCNYGRVRFFLRAYARTIIKHD